MADTDTATATPQTTSKGASVLASDLLSAWDGNAAPSAAQPPPTPRAKSSDNAWLWVVLPVAILAAGSLGWLFHDANKAPTAAKPPVVTPVTPTAEEIRLEACKKEVMASKLEVISPEQAAELCRK